MMIPSVILLAFFVAEINYVQSLQLAERDIKDLCLDSLGMIEMGFKQDYVIDTMEKVFEKKYQYDHPDVALTLTERALLRSLVDLMTQIKFGTRSRPSSTSEATKGSTSYSSRGPGGYNGNVMSYPGTENKVSIELTDDQTGTGSALLNADIWTTGQGQVDSTLPLETVNSMNKVANSDAKLTYVYSRGSQIQETGQREEPAMINIRKGDDESPSPATPMWRGSSKESASKTHSAITKSAAVKQTCNAINFPASLDSDNYSQWAASIQALQSQIPA